MSKRLLLPLLIGLAAAFMPLGANSTGTFASEPLGAQQDDVVLTMSNPSVHPRVGLPNFVVTGGDAALSSATTVVADVLWDDLDFEREYYMIARKTSADMPVAAADALDFDRWTELGADVVLVGSASKTGIDMTVELRAIGVRGENRGRQVFGAAYPNCRVENPRFCAHAIADDFHKKMRALDGVARTKLAFTSDRDSLRVSGRPSQTQAQGKEIYISDYDGANQMRFTVNRNLNINPAWSPTGRLLAYVSYMSGVPDVYIANVAEPGRGLVRPAGGNPNAQNWTPAWSPDGSKLAFVSTRSGNSDIWTANADGTGQQNLTNNPAIDNAPSWSPDGSKIAFTSTRAGTNQLYVMSASGTGVQRLVGDLVDRPTWSSLNFIAVTVGSGPGHDIAIYDFNNPGVLRVLTDGVGSNESPAVSPNGRHIAFVTSRWGRQEIGIIDRTGEHLKRVTDTGNNTYPNWQSLVGR